ncbi:hypothetical protein F53441_14596 [Fusarium austroafricanum]|uniref:Cyanovirin-N domain-containing protein n=1 Tax=Fusarium austroafricanum TaxID=2364996 RepID=A0A8H4NB50_9HYPO|nr:hypothetical protein F53441_14596 [Fusarium austroafricanum]
MRFVSVAAAFLALLGFSCAWTQDKDGVWVANNNWYWIDNYHAHEACTRRNEHRTHTGQCAYFTNDRGDIFHGNCAIALDKGFSTIDCRN